MDTLQLAGRQPLSSAAPPKAHRRREAVCGVLLCLGVLLALYLLAYKPIHEWFHTQRMEQLINGYDQAVAALTPAERDDLLAAARAYNDSLPAGTHFRLSEGALQRYNAQLDVTGTGMMGYIQIPKIGVELPIYHTTDAEILEEAVGHIPGSSLPVGGSASHTVLCGHRDLSTAYLFHDLDKLAEGDTFTLTVLGETVTYAVDQVRIVSPKEIDDLAIEAGADLCTLVTCHPHGSSEFRMLVRGRRVA